MVTLGGHKLNIFKMARREGKENRGKERLRKRWIDRDSGRRSLRKWWNDEIKMKMKKEEILYCTVLYCTVLYCIVSYCIVWYGMVWYCIVLYCIVLYCIVLYCIVLYCIEIGRASCRERVSSPV